LIETGGLDLFKDGLFNSRGRFCCRFTVFMQKGEFVTLLTIERFPALGYVDGA
jgi:hypothetical protein